MSSDRGRPDMEPFGPVTCQSALIAASQSGRDAPLANFRYLLRGFLESGREPEGAADLGGTLGPRRAAHQFG